MQLLKTIFPFSFGVKDVVDLIIKIVIYILVGVVATLICWVIGLIPFIGGILAWLLGTVIDLYVLVGIVVAVLVFCKILE